MGRKNDIGNKTSLVDQYRKQLGRQEKKVVAERRKDLKRLETESEAVSYWKSILWTLAGVLFLGALTYSSLVYYLAPKESL